ncbi:MAG: hypothetical protein ACPKPY_05870 [Nitrososphaeraceae archaeon]
MSDNLENMNEKEFRLAYINELRTNKHFISYDKLEEELRSVKQQSMKTPGRRGEQIKFEEISNEILRRMSK